MGKDSHILNSVNQSWKMNTSDNDIVNAISRQKPYKNTEDDVVLKSAA